MGLYPTLLVDEETVTATDEFLAQHNAATQSPAGRRLLIEARDGIERAIRARRKDAGA
jgi:aminopeptidase N